MRASTRQEAEKIRRLRAMRSGFNEEGQLHDFLRDAYAGTGGFRNGQVPSPAVTFWGNRSYERGWMARDSWWNIYQDTRKAFNGRSPGKPPGPAQQTWSYIQPFPGEDNFTYLDRVNNSNYVNNVQPIVRVTNSFLTKKPPQRANMPEKLAEWITGVTIDKRHLDEHAKNVCWRGQVVGWCATLIDLPSIQAANLSDSEREGVRPYLTTYWPQEIWEYDISSGGELTGIKFVREHEVDRKSMLDPKTYVQEIVIWTRERWERYLISVPGPVPEDGREPDLSRINRILEETSGANPFIDPVTGEGVVPVAFFRWDEALDGHSFNGQPQILALSQIARKHYNQQSELDYMLRSQVFGQLVGPVNTGGAQGAVQGTVQVGYGNFLPEPTEAKGIWRYISPDGSCAENYEKALERNKRDGYRISLIDSGESKNAETAEGRKIRFQQTDAMLSSAAGNLDRWERTIIRIVGYAYKISTEDAKIIEISRDRDYAIISLNDAVDSATKVLDLDIGVEATVSIVTRMVLAQVPDVSEEKSLEIQAQIRAEVTKKLGKLFNVTGDQKAIDSLLEEFQWVSIIDSLEDGNVDVAVSAEKVAMLTAECEKRDLEIEAKAAPAPAMNNANPFVAGPEAEVATTENVQDPATVDGAAKPVDKKPSPKDKPQKAAPAKPSRSTAQAEKPAKPSEK